jgi:hypothetical protein
MNETSQAATTKRSRHHVRNRFSGGHNHRSYLEPVFYFSGAIVILTIAKLLHSNILILAPGALGVVILSVSKSLKWRPGAFFSFVCILLTVMMIVWHWTNHYFMAVLSGEFYSKPPIFFKGFTDSLISAGLVWIYQQLLSTFHTHSGQKWSGKNLYVKFFKLLFYFLLFFLFFWIFAFVMYKSLPLTRLDEQDSTMIASALAILGAGIPAIIYISKGSTHQNRRHHGHRHRHTRNNQLKNTNTE